MDDRQGSQREFPVLDGLYLEFKNLLRRVEPPPDVSEHFRRARVEMLKGVREIIDKRIEHLERKEQRGQKIDIE
jgi:hypothetical protein